ncbi:MAG TPA: hypothetical protein VND64_35035 [Pirellulales bacterium]|nr:hypothetical protein [Pirellulales bacterium]
MDETIKGMAELNTPYWENLKRRDRLVVRVCGYASLFVVAVAIVFCVAIYNG